jgi:hypothetical protein
MKQQQLTATASKVSPDTEQSAVGTGVISNELSSPASEASGDAVAPNPKQSHTKHSGKKKQPVQFSSGAKQVMQTFMREVLVDARVQTGSSTFCRQWLDAHTKFRVEGMSAQELYLLQPEELATHAEALIPFLCDVNINDRQSALLLFTQMPQRVVLQHITPIVARLNDDSYGVRKAALEALQGLPAEHLAAHCSRILLKIRDPEPDVQSLALSMMTKDVIDAAIHRAVSSNDWVKVNDVCRLLPENDAHKVELRRLLDEHASAERLAMLENPNITLFVLSTRYNLPRLSESSSLSFFYDGLTPLECSDLVKKHLEGFPGVKVFNPNRDNAALQSGDEEIANGLWLRVWRQMLVRAQETGGCVLRLDFEEAGLSDMQIAESDMAADKRVPVISVPFDTKTSANRLLHTVDRSVRIRDLTKAATQQPEAPQHSVQGSWTLENGKKSQLSSRRKLSSFLASLRTRVRLPSWNNIKSEQVLLAAVAAGDTTAVRALLADGADPEVADSEGWTPLIRAAEVGSHEIIMALCQPRNTKFVRNVNAASNSGVTALMMASMEGHASIVEFLLGSAFGVRVDMTDIHGKTASQLALEHGHPLIYAMLVPEEARKKATQLRQEFMQARLVHVLSTRYVRPSSSDPRCSCDPRVSAATIKAVLEAEELVMNYGQVDETM